MCHPTLFYEHFGGFSPMFSPNFEPQDKVLKQTPAPAPKSVSLISRFGPRFSNTDTDICRRLQSQANCGVITHNYTR